MLTGRHSSLLSKRQQCQDCDMFDLLGKNDKNCCKHARFRVPFFFGHSANKHTFFSAQSSVLLICLNVCLNVIYECGTLEITWEENVLYFNVLFLYVYF